MDTRLLIIDLTEKVCLIATAGLVTVLVPALRKRLLGVGRPRDRFAAAFLGMLLAMWGARLGDFWRGYDVNLRNIGIIMAGVLAGSRPGLVVGALAGMFYVYRVPEVMAGWPAILDGLMTGWMAGLVAERWPKVQQGLRMFGAALVVQLIALAIATAALLVMGQPWPGPRFFEAILLHVAMNGAGVALLIAVARLVLTREEHVAALAEARAAAQALALESLRRKLEPHFLFNALNTLRGTIRTDPMLARELVADLADLYRYLLHHPDDAPLNDEVEHATSYLNIERARLGQHRLHIETDIPAELRGTRVPALLLQPIVENAVKHGIATRAGGGTVSIRAQRDSGRLVVEVRDRGEGAVLGTAERGSGIALEALREALQHRFGGEAHLVLLRSDDATVCRVQLPLDHLAGMETTTG